MGYITINQHGDFVNGYKNDNTSHTSLFFDYFLEIFLEYSW